jgi:multimeric flavodoxin WrbA
MMRRENAPNVIAVVGSPRTRGNTSLLVDVALKELEGRGLRCEKVELAKRGIAPCHGHDSCGDFEACKLDDEAAHVLDLVYAADGLILATPVCYDNVSAQMKAFIDRNFFRYNHEQRLSARAIGLVVVGAESGLEETLAALRRYVAYSTQDEVPIFSASGYAGTAGSAADSPELLRAARQMGVDLAGALS